MIRIELKDDGLTARLDNLARMGRDLRPAMRDIGEYLVRSTKKRFAAGEGPDDTAWAPNTAATLAGFLRRRAGGTVRRKGETIKTLQ